MYITWVKSDSGREFPVLDEPDFYSKAGCLTSLERDEIVVALFTREERRHWDKIVRFLVNGRDGNINTELVHHHLAFEQRINAELNRTDLRMTWSRGCYFGPPAVNGKYPEDFHSHLATLFRDIHGKDSNVCEVRSEHLETFVDNGGTVLRLDRKLKAVPKAPSAKQLKLIEEAEQGLGAAIDSLTGPEFTLQCMENNGAQQARFVNRLHPPAGIEEIQSVMERLGIIHFGLQQLYNRTNGLALFSPASEEETDETPLIPITLYTISMLEDKTDKFRGGFDLLDADEKPVYARGVAIGEVGNGGDYLVLVARGRYQGQIFYHGHDDDTLSFNAIARSLPRFLATLLTPPHDFLAYLYVADTIAIEQGSPLE